MNTARGKRMGWVAATLALLALYLTLATHKGFHGSADAMEAGIKSATDDPKDAAAEGLGVNLGEAGGVEGGEDISGDDGGVEPTPRATVHVLTEENFERITRVATGATTGDWFVDFSAVWSGHSKVLAGTWKTLAEKLEGEVNVGRVEVPTNKSLEKRFDVKGFPDVMFFSHGRVYRCRQRDLEGLLAFARGGYKDAKFLPVPPPPSTWDEPTRDGLTDMSSDVPQGIEELVGDNNPTDEF